MSLRCYQNNFLYYDLRWDSDKVLGKNISPNLKFHHILKPAFNLQYLIIEVICDLWGQYQSHIGKQQVIQKLYNFNMQGKYYEILT